VWAFIFPFELHATNPTEIALDQVPLRKYNERQAETLQIFLQKEDGLGNSYISESAVQESVLIHC